MNDNLLTYFNENPKIRQILPHQVGMLDFIIKHIESSSDGILLYSKPGTGKTLIGIISALLLSNTHKLLLLMPSENILNLWKNNIGMSLTLIDNKYNLDNITLLSMYSFISSISNNDKLITSLIQEYKNSIIIIDEAHNILNNSQFDKLLEMKKINNNKFILLTGSPINNTVETLPNLIKLIKEDVTTIDLNIIDTNQKVFEIKLKENKEDYIKQIFKNNVSFYETPKKMLPKIKYEGEFYGLTFNCVICSMTEEHYSIFNEAKQQSKNEVFEKILMNVSLFGIKNLYVTDDINKLQIKEYRKGLSFNGSYFIGNEFEKLNYAPKIKKMLNNFKQFGKHFIYFANASYGSLIIKSVMNYYGYSEFKINKTIQWSDKLVCYKCNNSKKCKKCIPATYIILTGQNINSISEYLFEYNKLENKDGMIIKLIFGSNVLSEAYTLKETLFTHYLTIPDTDTQIEQINGRTIRKFSIADLNSVVKIYLYLCVEPNFYKNPINKLTKYNDFVREIDNIVSYDYKKLLYVDLKKFETTKLLNIFEETTNKYNSNCSKSLNYIVLLNKLREIFFKYSRIKIKDLLNIYDNNIYNFTKQEFYKYVDEIIDNHPYVINNKFNLSLLYKHKNNEIITVPFSYDYGVIYNSYYMQKEINKIDISKNKNDVYLIIDRETNIFYKNSIMNIRSLTFEKLEEICLYLKIILDKNKKYFKNDLIELIIEKLKLLSSKDKSKIYIINNK